MNNKFGTILKIEGALLMVLAGCMVPSSADRCRSGRKFLHNGVWLCHSDLCDNRFYTLSSF